MMKPNVRQRRLLSLLIYLLVIAGLALLEGAFLALVLPLVVYLVLGLLTSPAPPQLTATRTLSAERVFEHASVSITLTLVNEGAKGADLAEVQIAERLPEGLTLVEGETSALATLPAGERITLSYTITGERGDFSFPPVAVTVSDSFGLYRQARQIATPAHLVILPKVWRLRKIAIRPLSTHGHAGHIPSGRAGTGVDFFGVREYRMGDPLRHINWRLTARHDDRPYTNEFEQQRVTDIGLILDARRQNEIRTVGGSLFEHAVQATAALADLFLSDGNRVGLLIYGRALERTFPGYGKHQRERILRALARAKLGDSIVFESLSYLPTRFFPAQSQIVFVSPLHPGDQSVLVKLRARGYQVIVISPDPVTFEAQHLTPSPSVELAQRIVRVERDLLLRKLRRVGVQVVDWPVHRSLDRVMQASLRRPPQVLRVLGGAR